MYESETGLHLIGKLFGTKQGIKKIMTSHFDPRNSPISCVSKSKVEKI